MESVMPKGVNWIKEYASKVDGEKNIVETASGEKISYEYLVFSSGLKIDNSLVKVLTEVIDKLVVS